MTIVAKGTCGVRNTDCVKFHELRVLTNNKTFFKAAAKEK